MEFQALISIFHYFKDVRLLFYRSRRLHMAFFGKFFSFLSKFNYKKDLNCAMCTVSAENFVKFAY